MGLPSIPLPQSKVEIGGQTVEFRSLSRKEATQLGTQFKDNPDAGEAYLIAKAVGGTEEEAAAWRDATPFDEVTKLIEGILILSGLVNEDNPNLASALKKSMNEPS